MVGGSLTVARGARRHSIPMGSVVAYRLGPGLSWSASPGTRLRWSARPVRVSAGDVMPWTADLALDVPQVDAAHGRRRRRFLASLAVAMAWIVAIMVAWCYSDTHAQRGDEQRRAGAANLRPPTPAEAAQTAAIVAEFGAQGFALEKAWSYGTKGNKFLAHVLLGRSDQEAGERERLRLVVDRVAKEHRLKQLRVALLDGEEHWTTAVGSMDGPAQFAVSENEVHVAAGSG